MIYKIKPKDFISVCDLLIHIEESNLKPEMVLIDTETHQLSIEIAPFIFEISKECR
jgi:hypothetical protein